MSAEKIVVRQHIEHLNCPSCQFPMVTTHRYQAVHRSMCDNSNCKLYKAEFETPYIDHELVPVKKK